jgi:GNAT superfamily N-acetyltransferase
MTSTNVRRAACGREGRVHIVAPTLWPVEIAPVDVAELTGPLAGDVAAVMAAALEHVPVPPPTAETFGLSRRHGDEPLSGAWVARDRRGGRVVGWAELIEPAHEYVDTVILRGGVHPDHQRRGLGRALLDAASASTVRPRLRARAWDGTAGAAALRRLGFEPRLTHVVNALDLALPADHWTALADEAAPAAAAYTLHRRVGPTPPADLPEMVVLREAINDAPDALEFEAYPVERIAAYEQSLVARRQTQHTIVARHTATGEPAGLTMVCVEEHLPDVAFQEDTSVLPAHRGHRLGLLMKVEMARWLREARPDVRETHTWNDHTNRHMIAVNERLGTRPVAASTMWTRNR